MPQQQEEERSARERRHDVEQLVAGARVQARERDEDRRSDAVRERCAHGDGAVLAQRSNGQGVGLAVEAETAVRGDPRRERREQQEDGGDDGERHDHRVRLR